MFIFVEVVVLSLIISHKIYLHVQGDNKTRHIQKEVIKHMGARRNDFDEPVSRTCGTNLWHEPAFASTHTHVCRATSVWDLGWCARASSRILGLGFTTQEKRPINRHVPSLHLHSAFSTPPQLATRTRGPKLYISTSLSYATHNHTRAHERNVLPGSAFPEPCPSSSGPAPRSLIPAPSPHDRPPSLVMDNS